MSKTTEIKVGTRVLKVSNLDKVLYPQPGFTKADVIDYYVKVSSVLLPHLRDRPITLKRYPDGVDGFFFYEKQCPGHRPKWIRTTKVAAKREEGHVDYCIMDDLPALVWAANLADLELHTFLHKAPKFTRPTALAFDLDPGAPADILDCVKVALLLKDCFDALGLQSFAKTSGKKGLQIYVPLNTAVTYERTKAFAHEMALLLERMAPERIVSRMDKSLRQNKVLIDWSQNDDHKTTINVYSLRAAPSPTVSTPVTWDELRRARNASTLQFTSDKVLDRIAKQGDLFEPVLSLQQNLPPLRELKTKKR